MGFPLKGEGEILIPPLTWDSLREENTMESKSTPSTNPTQTHPTIKPNDVRSKKRNDLKKYDREQMRIGLKKRELQSTKSTALSYIRQIKRTREYDIKAILHRIILSGDRWKREIHNLNAIKDFLGDLWFDPNFKPEDRGGMYEAMFVKQLLDFQINIPTTPLTGFYPPIMVEIHPRKDISLESHKDFLIQLGKSLPGLKVSKVEYAIDIYCPLVADVLFWVFQHSLSIPHQRTIRFFPDRFTSLGKRTNCSIIWGYEDDPDRVYERGEDGDKKGEGWDYDNVDRVRLEHTANWKELRNHGISTLEDLINTPKFHEINKGIWNFRRFKQGKRLKKKFPQEWEDYSEKDDRGYSGSFQAQYIRLGKPRGYVESVPELTILKESLIESMMVFDNRWGTLPII